MVATRRKTREAERQTLRSTGSTLNANSTLGTPLASTALNPTALTTEQLLGPADGAKKPAAPPAAPAAAAPRRPRALDSDEESDEDSDGPMGKATQARALVMSKEDSSAGARKAPPPPPPKKKAPAGSSDDDDDDGRPPAARDSSAAMRSAKKAAREEEEEQRAARPAPPAPNKVRGAGPSHQGNTVKLGETTLPKAWAGKPVSIWAKGGDSDED